MQPQLIPIQDKVLAFQFANLIVDGRVETVQMFGSTWATVPNDVYDELVNLKAEADALNALLDEGRNAMRKPCTQPAPMPAS